MKDIGISQITEHSSHYPTLELTKNGIVVDSIIVTSGNGYGYNKDIGGGVEVTIIAVHIKSISRGETNVVTVDRICQIPEALIG